MQNNGGLVDVISGNKPFKVDVSVSADSILYIGVTILVAVVLGVVVAIKISK